MNKNKKRFKPIDKDYKNIKEYKVNKQTELLEYLLEKMKLILEAILVPQVGLKYFKIAKNTLILHKI